MPWYSWTRCRVGEAERYRYRDSSLPRALGGPVATGRLRTTPEDFRVDEILGFEADGEGEHFLVAVRKRELTTVQAAERLAGFCGVPTRDVSWAGLKDRNALTTQWFSVRMPGTGEPDWPAMASDTLTVLEARRHRRKLRPGALRGNRFRLVVRGLAGDPSGIPSRIRVAARRGVPNYFGPQRFGREGDNAVWLVAGRLPKPRRRQSIFVSAGRSWLFNRVLATRVAAGSWDRLGEGEVCMLDGSRSVFAAESADHRLPDRLRDHDIHPTGPLWGEGEGMARGRIADLEDYVAADCRALCRALSDRRLKPERRALRLPVRGLECDLSEPGRMVLEFELPPGAFATAVVREIIQTQE